MQSHLHLLALSLQPRRSHSLHGVQVLIIACSSPTSTTHDVLAARARAGALPMAHSYLSRAQVLADVCQVFVTAPRVDHHVQLIR